MFVHENNFLSPRTFREISSFCALMTVITIEVNGGSKSKKELYKEEISSVKHKVEEFHLEKGIEERRPR